MKKDKQKYYLGITEFDHPVFQAWITEEQRTFIEKHIGYSTESFQYNPHVDEIIDTICKYCRVPVDLLPGKIRYAEIVRCRYLCFYFFVNKLHYSTVRSGKILNRDHSTVVYALKMVPTKYINDIIEISKLLNTMV